MKKHNIALSLGANMGNPAQTFQEACAALAPYLVVHARSPLYRGIALYAEDQPAFVNAVVCGETQLEPMALLYTVRNIERNLGRMPTFLYGPRVIDIDILFFDDCQMHTPELTLPHPQIAERLFVLRPLADVLPDWVHPLTGKNVATMLRELEDKESVRVLEPAW